MAALLCNNGNEGGVCNKSKGFYASLFRGRKAARRSKPPANGVPIKKERKRECESWENEDQSLKKRRVLMSDCASVDEFESLGTIGGGSYGVVYKVREKKTGEIMAMKDEMDGSTPATLREIEILKSLAPHPNVVGFKKVATDGCEGVYVLMEYMETDLKSYIALKKEEGIAIDGVKALMKQLLQGVKFLHENGVMHIDLKPANILVNDCGDLKICDFGQSVRFEEVAGPYSCRVGTLWYRAPELLLGVEKYSTEVDMWGVGCVMAEVVLKKVLFRGKDEDDQLHEIYCILGAPNARVCSSISSANKVLSEAGFDLLKGLLSYDQRKRTSAEAALNHVWFRED